MNTSPAYLSGSRPKFTPFEIDCGRSPAYCYTGGTFTISNMGIMNVENFGAIINPGESAILATASTQAQPVVREGKIVVRQLMRLTLSCDHRLVDGSLGARFANAVKQKLEDLGLWKSLAT